MTAKTAADVAQQAADSIRDHAAFVTTHIAAAQAFIDATVSVALADDPAAAFPAAVGAPTRALLGLPPTHHGEVQFAAMDVAVRRLWQRTRYVYDIDADLFDEIAGADTDAVPADLVARLPHIDPFVAFPKPFTLPLDKGERQEIIGMYVTGGADSVAGPLVCSTANPHANVLRVLLCGMVTGADGKPLHTPSGQRDVLWSRVTLDPRLGTVDAIAEASRSAGVSLATGADWDYDVPRMIRTAVNLLLYLCAENADFDTRPARPAGKRRPGKGTTAKAPRTVRVGYRVGAALRAARRATQATVGGGTARTVTPHVRRAHAHTYRVGPGRRDTIIRWISPTLIGFGNAEASTTTVVKA